jgi:hypothetical protein
MLMHSMSTLTVSNIPTRHSAVTASGYAIATVSGCDGTNPLQATVCAAPLVVLTCGLVGQPVQQCSSST